MFSYLFLYYHLPMLKIHEGRLQNALDIIEKYYEPDSKAYHFLVQHGKLVAHKALQVADRVKELNPDTAFIEEAAMLHDIGIYLTDEPDLGCFGDHPYICHGYLGRELLDKEGLPAHALVCERHVGAGITIEDIETRGLPLPKREMMPLTLEEKIICFADKFYSKSEHGLTREKSVKAILSLLSRYGDKTASVFKDWIKYFREEY